MPLLKLWIDFAPFLWQGCVIFKFLHSSWLQVELGRGGCLFLWDFDMKRKLVIYLYNKLGSKKSVFQTWYSYCGMWFSFSFFSSKFGCKLTDIAECLNKFKFEDNRVVFLCCAVLCCAIPSMGFSSELPHHSALALRRHSWLADFRQLFMCILGGLGLDV